MVMPNRIAAKPTLYNGTRFRSRLEARWAAFFDLAGWRWEYEPVDLDGWQPDFLLLTTGKPIPVEVKPIQWPGTRTSDALEAIVLGRADLQKVRDVVGVEILILGSYLPTFTGVYSQSPLGATIEASRMQDGSLNHFVDIAVLFDGLDRPLDWSVEYGSWHYRIGPYAGKSDLHEIDDDRVERIWREAGNLTQWRGR
ncbi:PDDEXK family nuclease [Methylobacterium planeticum]|uniref:Restriction endonuclease n=1 Tax=Methylobacterium planeticum TaxID=2615211 RepID=A0A6N6MGC6_9HYPH|nr:hypothetical protein [Methylobacterium planeticum]KAB1068891.1 hypothetical protein F6X51_26165 [Methylobacterium planeticum]